MSQGTKVFAIVGVIAIAAAGIFFWKSSQPSAPPTAERGFAPQ